MIVLPLLVNTGFQVLFHSPPGVLFTFPSRYYALSVTKFVFSLGGWSPLLPAGFLVSCGTLVPARSLAFSPTRLLLPLAALSNAIRLRLKMLSAGPQPREACSSVWALSLSLAATQEIDLSFSSSGYLDVSVPRVPSTQTMYSSESDGTLLPPGFPIRISTDHSLLAAPRSFSQLAASFIGAWCLGIHPVLFFALFLILRPILLISGSLNFNLQLALLFSSFPCAVVKIRWRRHTLFGISAGLFQAPVSAIFGIQARLRAEALKTIRREETDSQSFGLSSFRVSAFSFTNFRPQSTSR